MKSSLKLWMGQEIKKENRENGRMQKNEVVKGNS